MNICMAHRGWSGKAPENTMAAFHLCFDEPQIQAIECDVQLSKDGVPIVIHDFTVERTTNATGFVAEFDYVDLSKLDAGSWFSSAYAGERIPRLEDVLKAAKGKCKLNLELKKAGELYPGLEKKVLELIYHVGMESEVCLTSFNHEVVRKVGELDSEIPTGLIVYGKPLLLREQMKFAGASILSMSFAYLTKEWVHEMIGGEGYTIVAWTVDDPQMIQRVMDLHPDIQICTNYPERMWGAEN